MNDNWKQRYEILKKEHIDTITRNEEKQKRIDKAIEYINKNKYENTFRLVGNEETGEMESLNGELLDLLKILGDKE